MASPKANSSERIEESSLLRLAAEGQADVRAQRILAHHLLHFAHRRAQVDAAQVRGHQRHARLVGAVDLARANRLDHVGDGGQADRTFALRVDDDAADVVDGGA
jgi:hypothetical protein